MLGAMPVVRLSLGGWYGIVVPVAGSDPYNARWDGYALTRGDEYAREVLDMICRDLNELGEKYRAGRCEK
jgi:hypothetical protein